MDKPFAYHLARARGAPPADRPARAALRQPTAVANFFFTNTGSLSNNRKKQGDCYQSPLLRLCL